MQISRRRIVAMLPALGLAPALLAAEEPDWAELNLSSAETAELQRRAQKVIGDARVLLELPLGDCPPALGYRPQVIQTPGFGDLGRAGPASQRPLPSTPADLCSLSIADAAELLRRRSIGPVELTRAHLERIERLDSHLRTLITLSAERAMAEAKIAADDIARGHYRGPLHGIPISIKDCIATAGIRTTYACRAFADSVPGQDATVVRRLREAGAVLLGKANLFEMCWVGTSEDGDFKPARNPWNSKYPTGGSSTGSAVGVVAGLAMGSVGSDSGGSIRNPASYCGATGLMPTYGRVSRGGVSEFAHSLGSIGPLARSAEDAAILLAALAGHDAADPLSSPLSVPNYPELIARSIRGLRIGVCPSYLEAAGVDVEVMAALESALEVFRSLGATVRDVHIPHLPYARATVWTILLSEGLLTHFDLLCKQRDRISERLFQGLAVGMFLSAQDYLRAQQARTLIARQMQQAFETVDILLMPSNPATAAPGTYRSAPTDPKIARGGESYSTPSNLYGNPAVSLPSGFNRLGLPMAIQLSGRPFDEATVLTAAHQFQLATDWHRRRPNLGA